MSWSVVQSYVRKTVAVAMFTAAMILFLTGVGGEKAAAEARAKSPTGFAISPPGDLFSRIGQMSRAQLEVIASCFIWGLLGLAAEFSAGSKSQLSDGFDSRKTDKKLPLLREIWGEK